MQPPAGLDRRLAPELTKADQPTCRIVLEKPVLAHDVVGGEEQRRAVCLGDDPYLADRVPSKRHDPHVATVREDSARRKRAVRFSLEVVERWVEVRRPQFGLVALPAHEGRGELVLWTMDQDIRVRKSIDSPDVVPIQVCDHDPPNCHRIKLFGAQLRADVTWPGCGNRRKPPLYPRDMDACGKARVDQDGSLWVFNDIAQDRKLEVLARAKQGREPLTSPKGLVPNQGTGLNCVRLHPGAS